MSGFTRAVKSQTKARVAFYGVGGSGKTTHALTLARVLAGPDGTIALLDTEGGSAAKYADEYVFDHLIQSPPYHPQRFADALDMAVKGGYSVFVADGITAFWSGAGGVQSIVDASPKKWAEGSPAWQKLVNAILDAPIHVVFTVRAKGETLVDKDANGRTTMRKVGLKPDAREGIEYEVDALMYCDVADNSVTSEKTRIRGQLGMTLKPERVPEWCELYKAWLAAGAPAPQPAPPAAPAPAPAAAPQAAAPAPAPAGDPTGGLGPAPAPAPAETTTPPGSTVPAEGPPPPAPAGEVRVAIRERIKAAVAGIVVHDAEIPTKVAAKIAEWYPGNEREGTLSDEQADDLATKLEATLERYTGAAS